MVYVTQSSLQNFRDDLFCTYAASSYTVFLATRTLTGTYVGVHQTTSIPNRQMISQSMPQVLNSAITIVRVCSSA